MAAPLYPGRRLRTGQRGVSVTECALALSVIVGFTFVTIRVFNLGSSTSGIHAALPATHTTATETTVAKNQPPLLASDTSDTKTP
jgi:hypothetical protein